MQSGRSKVEIYLALFMSVGRRNAKCNILLHCDRLRGNVLNLTLVKIDTGSVKEKRT